VSEEIRFLVFATEYYRIKRGLSGKNLATMFEEHDIYKMIIDNYFIYHIESPDHFVKEIDAVLQMKDIKKKDM